MSITDVRNKQLTKLTYQDNDLDDCWCFL